MAVTRVLSVLVLVVTTQGSVGPSSNGSFCTESRECLQYQLLCKTDEYEVRHYSPTLWVSTDAEAYFMGVGAAMAFRRLFQYITGDNEGGYQIDMTAPVLVKIPEETTMWEPAIYTLSFPLPQAYQEKPPQPTNDKLYFTKMLDMDVYVRSYGGWMLSVTSRLQAHQLTKELDRVGAKYNNTHHYGVGYDSPLKLLNRHNEVWYVCEGKAVCMDPQEPTPAHPPRPLTDEPFEGAPEPGQNVPAIPSAHPEDPSATAGNSSSSLSPLPIALSLSAATPNPPEKSTHANSSILEPSTHTTPFLSGESTHITSSISEQATQSLPHTSEESTNTSSNIAEQSAHNFPRASEENTLIIPNPSNENTPGLSEESTTKISEDNTRNAPDSSEESTQSAPSIHDTSDSPEQSTQSLAEKSSHDVPVNPEKST